ncbi:MAG: hypothetical protein ACPGGK_16125 [Pikeienuella sp.]
MYTVLVTYTFPKPVTRDALVERFKQSEARFRALPKLIRKYFCYDETSRTGRSVYLWENEADARAFFSKTFLAGFEDKFGCKPEIIYTDTLMVVDNEQDKTIVNTNDSASRLI